MADRVLLVVQTYPDGGGISSIIENYVNELEGRFEVHVAIVEERLGRQDRLRLDDHRVHVLGYSNVINPLLMPTSLLFAALVGAFLRRLVARLHPVAVVVQDALNLPVPGLIATRGVETTLVVMDHGTLTNVHDPAWLPMVLERLSRIRRPLFRLGFAADTPWRSARWRLGVAKADALWFTGEELKPWFGRAGDRAVEYSQTVPIDFQPPSAQERDKARRRFELSPDTKLFNVVGRLDREKGLDEILVAAQAVEQHPTRWRLAIAGDGTLEPWMRGEIVRRRLEDRVMMLGRLDRAAIGALQQASDFHVYAGTISCGVSICLLEAMATGVLPIVSDVPRLQHSLVGDAGWVFPAGDARALADAWRAALDTPDAELGERREKTLRRVRQPHAPTVPELLERILSRESSRDRSATL